MTVDTPANWQSWRRSVGESASYSSWLNSHDDPVQPMTTPCPVPRFSNGLRIVLAQLTPAVSLHCPCVRMRVEVGVRDEKVRR